ncbi:hypothetical protein BD770DRAFT_466028 [Pilaira anomala]|nr:hypothetical protein BD770DRAFT_466028 [Pilaira anomala]
MTQLSFVNFGLFKTKIFPGGFEFNEEVRTLYLRLDLKYCRTITALDICTFERDNSFGVKEDDLHSFIGRFPDLKYLKGNFEGGFSMATVNLNQLLNVVPQLQTLKLYKMNEIITTGSQDKDLKGALQDSKLTTLRLTAAEINIKSIKSITSNLINIDRLDFIVKSITPDTKLSKEGSHKILKAIKLYALKMKRFVTEYSYRNRTFFKEINKIKTTDYGSDGYEEIDEDDSDSDEEEEEDEGFDFEEFLLDMELRR